MSALSFEAMKMSCGGHITTVPRADARKRCVGPESALWPIPNHATGWVRLCVTRKRRKRWTTTGLER